MCSLASVPRQNTKGASNTHRGRARVDGAVRGSVRNHPYSVLILERGRVWADKSRKRQSDNRPALMAEPGGGRTPLAIRVSSIPRSHPPDSPAVMTPAGAETRRSSLHRLSSDTAAAEAEQASTPSALSPAKKSGKDLLTSKVRTAQRRGDHVL
jgi:hypothetical protein